MSSTEYHIQRAEKRLGPFTAGQVKGLARLGRIRPDDVIVNGGISTRASHVKGLFPKEPPAPRPSGHPSDDVRPAEQDDRQRFAVADRNPGETVKANAGFSTRDLVPIAAAFRRARIFESFLWLFAGYFGLLTSVAGWYAVLLGLPLSLIAAPNAPVIVVGLGVLGVVCALAGLALTALGFAYLAECLTRFRTPKWVWFAIGLPGFLFCSPLVLVAILFLVPGLYFVRRLQRTEIVATDGPQSPYRTLADVFQSEGTLESLATDEQRKRHRAEIAKTLVKYGWFVVLIHIAMAIVTFVIGMLLTPLRDVEGLNLIVYLVLTIVGFVTVFFVSTRLSHRLHDARRVLAPSLSDARSRDSRRPILLLRSFRDENDLTHPGELGFLSLTRSAVRSLEEHLTDRLWRFGPVIALGLPGEKTPPIGSAREYIDATRQNWQHRFAELASDCGTIVMVAGNTPGLAWETRHLLNRRHLDRLLIVVPPWMSQSEWLEFCDAGGLAKHVAKLEVGDDEKNCLLGLRFDNLSPISYLGPANQFGYEALSVVAVAEQINSSAALARNPAS